jgi:hypothetical protein
MDAVRHEDDEEKEAFLSPQEDVETAIEIRSSRVSYVRLLLEVAMALSIVLLLMRQSPSISPSPTGKASPVPSCMYY